MTIHYLCVDEIKEYENNPRHNESAVDAVAASINTFGFKVPIVIDKENVIIAGHTRVLAAQKLGLEKVPCIVADDLTPEQVKAFRLADNKTGELAEWDFNALAKEIAELETIDVSQFGFDTDEINADGFGEEFELPDGENPQSRTITLTLSEEQFIICENVIEHFEDNINHDFGNKNQKSNALFEAVYEWAKQNNLL